MASIDKIAAGVRRIERERTGAKPESLDAFVGSPTDYSSLNSLWSDLDLKSKRLNEMLSGINIAVEKYRDQQSTILQTAIPDRKQREEAVAKLVAVERKRMLTVGEADRLELLRAVRSAGAKVAASKSDLTDAVVLMDRSTRGKDARRLASEGLSAAGPRQLEAALREALSLGGDAGACLASACYQRLDMLPADARRGFRYPKRDVAEMLTHEQWQGNKRLISQVELLVSSAEISVRESLGERTASAAKINHGILKMQARGGDTTDTRDDAPAGDGTA